MKRKIYNQLVEWKKQNGKTALLVNVNMKCHKNVIIKMS